MFNFNQHTLRRYMKISNKQDYVQSSDMSKKLKNFDLMKVFFFYIFTCMYIIEKL